MKMVYKRLEDGRRKSEIGRRKTEVGSRESGVGSKESEDRSRKLEVGRPKKGLILDFVQLMGISDQRKWANNTCFYR